MSQERQLVDRLRRRCCRKRTPLIAIGGFGGAGKTTLAELLAEAMTARAVVHLDDFYVPALGRADTERLRTQVLEPLSQGRPAQYQRFDWKSNSLTEWHEIAPGGPVIIEGVSTLYAGLLHYYDFKIWVECPQEVAFKRGVARDLEQYRVDSEEEWLTIWIPQERDYVEAHRPVERADFIFYTHD